MRKKATLLDRAKIDLQVAKDNLKNAETDELFLDVAAYHIQQAIEKSLKFHLEINGIEYPLTHDVGALWEQADENKLSPPKWIYDNYETLNTYSTKTRYGASIIGTRRKIIEFCDALPPYLATLSPKTTTIPKF